MGNNLTERVRNTNGQQPGSEVAQQQPKTLADQIRDMEPQFRLAQPKGAEAAQLVRDALTALRTTRNLDRCDATTVLGALMTCAQLGLRPSVSGLGHAWVLPYWDKHTSIHRAQLIIGYQGYRELAMRSGMISTVIGRMVHEHDHFDIDYGVADNLIHKPKLDGPRGEPIGYYSIVKYTSGGYAFWHMTRSEVEEHRDSFASARNRQGQIVGPWRDNFDEMAVKTTFRKLAKWMPKSPELAAAIAADETVRVDLTPNLDATMHGEHPTLDGEVVETDEQAEQESAEQTAE